MHRGKTKRFMFNYHNFFCCHIFHFIYFIYKTGLDSRWSGLVSALFIYKATLFHAALLKQPGMSLKKDIIWMPADVAPKPVCTFQHQMCLHRCATSPCHGFLNLTRSFPSLAQRTEHPWFTLSHSASGTEQHFWMLLLIYGFLSTVALSCIFRWSYDLCFLKCSQAI